jgi:hypothetical protein
MMKACMDAYREAHEEVLVSRRGQISRTTQIGVARDIAVIILRYAAAPAVQAQRAQVLVSRMLEIEGKACGLGTALPEINIALPAE